ncbi:MAG: insulinase family protein [Oscillospiraceae bacterium]|nr:insulinase family protein [Oscillospiraceae bacterium]
MYEMITLPNGVRIVTQPVPAVRTAAVGVFVGTGSRHESAKENGAAHFLEHMAFKSTLTRSTDRLAMDIDSIGGQMNAYTTKESTCFYTRCLDLHLPRAIELLGDMLLNGAFLEEEVDTERGVILEEIGMYRDTPEDLVNELLNAAVYKGHSLARPILGTRRTLSAMTGAWLRDYRRSHYLPHKIVISLAGSFTQSDVEQLKNLFSTLTPGKEPRVRAAQYCPAVTVRRKAIEQNHIIIGFPAPSFLDDRRYQMTLLSSILGGGVSSRLFQQVREQQGLCYTVYSYISDHEDTGLLGLYTALSPQTEDKALSTICRVAAEMAEHGPTADELDRAREQAKANVLMGLESTQARMSHAGNSMLLRGKVSSPDEILAAYDAVTARQLRDLAGEVLDFSRASVSAVGRVRTGEDYQSNLTRFL